MDFLGLIGSLTLFLYGMQLMSSSLQKVAGSRMRAILSTMTSNRVVAVFTGFLITTIVQSSSATTVMIVSFVNAGLLTLTESIGLIMGANIGTTVTGWLVSLLGFKVKISAIAPILMAFCLPFMFSKNVTRKAWAETVIGFAILFIGLDFLKHSVPDIKSNPEMLGFLSGFADVNFFTTILFMIIGTVLTVVLQSSSATMTLTLALCFTGVIPFHLAAAMVLGENIGTTITANLAATVANANAKKAARAHLIFNIIGVSLALIVFSPFINLVANITEHFTSVNPFQIVADAATEAKGEAIGSSITLALALFHTIFNISNTLLQIWFVPQIANIVQKVVKEDHLKHGKLEHISMGLLATPELSLVQAKKEIIWFSKHAKKSFNMLEGLYDIEKDKDFSKVFDKVEKYESISNKVDTEIANYLTEVSKDENSDKVSHRIMAMFKISNEIESVSDSTHTILKVFKFARENNVKFPDEIKKEIVSMHKLLTEAFECMIDNLSGDYHLVSLDKADLIEGKINRYRDHLKKTNFSNIKKNIYSYKVGSHYTDIFMEYERMADYIVNVNEAIKEVRDSE
jgi:phosphate:Na+ symporter